MVVDMAVEADSPLSYLANDGVGDPYIINVPFNLQRDPGTRATIATLAMGGDLTPDGMMPAHIYLTQTSSV